MRSSRWRQQDLPRPAVGAKRTSTSLAQSSLLQLRRQFRRERSAGTGFQTLLNQFSQALLGLFLFVATNELAHILTRIPVLAGADALIDVRPQLVGQGKTHGRCAHGYIVRLLSIVVNIRSGSRRAPWI